MLRCWTQMAEVCGLAVLGRLNTVWLSASCRKQVPTGSARVSAIPQVRRKSSSIETSLLRNSAGEGIELQARTTSLSLEVTTATADKLTLLVLAGRLVSTRTGACSAIDSLWTYCFGWLLGKLKGERS